MAEMHLIDELNKRIEELEIENSNLRKWQESVNQLLNQMLDAITMLDRDKYDRKEIDSELEKLWMFSKVNRYRINSIPYELQDPDYKSFFFKPDIMTKNETIKQIKENGKSISRFGDGEFAAIVGQKRWNFQGESAVLAAKLREVLKSNEENCLVGLNPTFYMNLFDLPDDEADGVRAYMQPMVRRLHSQMLSPNKTYGNALFHSIDSDEDVKKLKEIWDKRDCVFIEGLHTGMGVGNDLFDNCRSIERILAPAENAIDKYDDIMREALKQPKNKLFLLALGPTATVLAYDLFMAGYQAVDIGHIDLIYEAYVRKLSSIYEVDISYKYCSRDERVAGRNIISIDDPVYKEQIVAVVK